MADQVIIRGIAVGGVIPQTAQSGRNYWIVNDSEGQEWRCWDAQTAMAANQLQGQLAAMTVSITPARDPSWGMNYRLKRVAPAPAGAQITTGPLLQPAQQELQQQFQPQAMPMGQAQPMMPTSAPMPMPQQAPAPSPQQPFAGPIRTMGQGGNFSDADITRMARSTAIEAVVGVAFHFEDFRDESGDPNWERIYAAAEAVHKFVLDRKHEGWVPGEEINPSSNDSRPNEQAVLAEVEAEFPGAVVQGLPETTSQGSADNAQGDEIPWE